MLVANSFDLWQKDAFFSAAEEVQQSVDIMQSSYRTWLRARREGWIPEHLDDLSRELQMALGTAKWQLEEFESAVRMSYRSHVDDITVSRHRQFVSALEDQIFIVERALKESFEVEGKKPFHWVNLDEEECDDLALFLSGTSETSQRILNEAVTTSLFNMKNNTKDDSNLVMINEVANCSLELEKSRFLETEETDRSSSNSRTWSPPDRRALEIVIHTDDIQKSASIGATSSEKGLKSFFGNSRGDDHRGAKDGMSSCTRLKMISWMNQHLRGGQRGPRQQLMSSVLPVNSIRFILGFMLTIFLVVPFLVSST